MPEYQWSYKSYITEPQNSANQIEFIHFDLTDVNLGFFVVAIQSMLVKEKITMIKEVVRDAINDFASTARPITAIDYLEKIFAYVNRHAGQELQPSDYRDTHIGLVYIKDDEMHFSMNGDFKIMMIRKNRVFDIIRMTYGLSPHNYDKLFSRMYSGSILPKDSLMIVTNETWDCFDSQKIPEIINKLPLDGTLEMLKNYFPENTAYRLGFFLTTCKPHESEVADKPKTKSSLTPSESIKVLINTEEDTSAWLSPSPLQTIQKIKTSVANISTVFSKTKDKRLAAGGIATISKIGSAIFATIGKVASIITQATKQTKQFSRTPKKIPAETKPKPSKTIRNNTSRPAREKISVTQKITAIPKYIRYQLDKIVRLYKKWPSNTKILLIIACILIALFWQSVNYMNQRNQQQELNTYFEDQVTQIENLQTQAEQAMIFKDFARARGLLIEADNTIAALPTTSTEQESVKTELQKINQQALSKANRLTIIPTPLALTTLATIQSTPQHILIGGNQLLIASDIDAVTIDPTSGETQSLELPNSISQINTIALEDPTDFQSDVLFFHNNTNVTSYSPSDQQFTQLSNSLSSNSNAIPALATFSDRVYKIDAQNNQIIRHLRSGDSFQAGSNWLNVPFDLGSATSLAIDGTIYVLDNNEGIVQFSQGERTSWTPESIEPSITTASKIYTTDETNFLTILDPDNQRFLLYTKQGEFIQQFSSPEFTNLTDIAILEQGSQITAYLLNEQTVYVVQFTITQ